MNFGATNKPGTCKWCGRRLVWKCHTEYEQTDTPPRRCSREMDVGTYERVRCDSRKFRRVGVGQFRCEHGHDNSGRQKIKSRVRRYNKPGGYGDGHFCGLNCGYSFAVVLANNGRLLQAKKEGK